MNVNSLWVRMMGELSMNWEENSVSGGRSRKVWLLIAFLIWNRERTVSEKELIQLIWQEEGMNQSNALKTLFHRARAALEPLALPHRAILRREGGWSWNPRIPVTVDAEEFVRLLRTAEGLEDRLRALELYRGPFLPQLRGRPWREDMASRLQEAYLETVLEVLPCLLRQKRWTETVELCRAAAEESPLSETVYEAWMEALLALEKQEEAVSVYETLRESTLSQLGTLPSARAQELYRQARRGEEPGGVLTPDALLERLRETVVSRGAYLCDFDFFRAVCQSVARDMARAGKAAHLALLTAHGENISPKSMALAVEHLQEVVRTHLRRGDVVSLCGAAQVVCLLPRADYANSRAVAERIIRAFGRQYPHAPVRLRAEIMPLGS